MRAPKTLFPLMLAGLVWLGGPVTNSARAAFLSDLIAGGTITDGNFVFSNFTYTPATGPPLPTAVTVTPYTDGSGNLGIQIGGGFIQSTPGTTDVRIGYTVTDTAGALITDVHMDGNPIVTPPTGSGAAIITESVTNINPTQTIQISSINPPGPSATLTLPGAYSTLNITKDILLTTSASGVVASVSFIDQTFSTSVPEPSSIVMMGLGVGLGGLVLRRRMTPKV